ncbi:MULTISPECIES: hypothetical protein [unclassified Nonomuraea]|nr:MULTISPECIES: hypothetical protein [unclassified Nonomuraea]
MLKRQLGAHGDARVGDDQTFQARILAAIQAGHLAVGCVPYRERA